jgi:hypothetical protein
MHICRPLLDDFLSYTLLPNNHIPCSLYTGSFAAVFVALVALLKSALSVISLALECLPLPDDAFVNDFVYITRIGKLDDDG